MLTDDERVLRIAQAVSEVEEGDLLHAPTPCGAPEASAAQHETTLDALLPGDRLVVHYADAGEKGPATKVVAERGG